MENEKLKVNDLDVHMRICKSENGRFEMKLDVVRFVDGAGCDDIAAIMSKLTIEQAVNLLHDAIECTLASYNYIIRFNDPNGELAQDVPVASSDTAIKN